jgi:hypothetical protein
MALLRRQDRNRLAAGASGTALILGDLCTLTPHPGRASQHRTADVRREDRIAIRLLARPRHDDHQPHGNTHVNTQTAAPAISPMGLAAWRAGDPGLRLDGGERKPPKASTILTVRTRHRSPRLPSSLQAPDDDWPRTPRFLPRAAPEPSPRGLSDFGRLDECPGCAVG